MSEAKLQSTPETVNQTLSFSTRWLFSRGYHYLLNKIIGRALTVIDASVADPVQRKAIKDVMRASFDQVQDNKIYVLDLVEKQIAVACGDAEEGDPICCSVELQDITLDQPDYKYTRTNK